MKVTETNDFECIARLNKPVHDLHYKLYPELFQPYDYDDIKQFFHNVTFMENHLFLLLEEEEKAIGYVWVEIIHSPPNVFKKAYEAVYVHQISLISEKRNKGYGKRLMEEVYRVAEKHNIQTILLDYWCDNTVAKEFYKKQGFKIRQEYVYKQI